LRQDIGGTPAAPTFLQFGDLWSAYEPNGSAHGSNIVNYDFVTTIPQSVVVSRLQCVAGETYSGKVTNIIMSNPKGVELHSTSATVNITAGQRAPGFAYSSNLTGVEAKILMESVCDFFNEEVKDINIATTKVIV
jgi:hypothetical protein